MAKPEGPRAPSLLPLHPTLQWKSWDASRSSRRHILSCQWPGGICLENLTRETSSRHSNQMPEPLRLLLLHCFPLWTKCSSQLFFMTLSLCLSEAAFCLACRFSSTDTTEKARPHYKSPLCFPWGLGICLLGQKQSYFHTCQSKGT